MARKGIIERENNRFKLFSKYYLKYKKAKFILKNRYSSDFERYKSRLILQKIPRNANFTRKRNRCLITGRPRGTFRRFGLSRFIIRKLSFDGYIPGIFKAS